MSEEECPNSSFVLGMPPNVYAQHVGKLLAYLESSVLKKGLMGIVVQKTNVSQLKIILCKTVKYGSLKGF